MMQLYAKTRGIKLFIITVPIFTPKLSSYWLYFVTSTSYTLAANLVDSMKMEVVCKDNRLQKILGIRPISYVDAIKLAFKKIEQNLVISSWKDAQTSNIISEGIAKLIEVPVNGCFKDIRSVQLKDSSASLEKIWAIGGKTGWYYGNWLWEMRGL